jgi:hypothetical protein
LSDLFLGRELFLSVPTFPVGASLPIAPDETRRARMAVFLARELRREFSGRFRILVENPLKNGPAKHHARISWVVQIEFLQLCGSPMLVCGSPCATRVVACETRKGRLPSGTTSCVSLIMIAMSVSRTAVAHDARALPIRPV